MALARFDLHRRAGVFERNPRIHHRKAPPPNVLGRRGFDLSPIDVDPDRSDLPSSIPPRGQQCWSNAATRSRAISWALRPSIWWRSSMKATSPSFSSAIEGDEGG